MARLFKKATTKPIPKGAERCCIKGAPSMRWMSRGKLRTAPLTENGARIAFESAKWYGTVNGKSVPLCRDKQTAERLLTKMEADAALVRVGLADPFAEHKRRPLSTHIDDFERHLSAKGSGTKHVGGVMAHLRTLATECRWDLLGDLTAFAAENWLSDKRGSANYPLPTEPKEYRPQEVASLLGISPQAVLAQIGGHGLVPGTGNGKAKRIPRETVQALLETSTRGIGPVTRNYYRRHLKQFGRWLSRERRIAENPFAHLAHEPTETDIRHRRRAATEAELTALIDCCRRSARSFRGLTGLDRALLYTVGFATGFRAAALATLTPARFELNADAPCVTIAAKNNKSRKTKTNPLPKTLVPMLAEYLGKIPTNREIWPGNWWTDAAEMTRLDLTEAGISAISRDADGLVFLDFHAIGRHTFLTHIARTSPLHVAQKLAGHSSPLITARYTHAGTEDLREAVERLPDMAGTIAKVCSQFAGTQYSQGQFESSSGNLLSSDESVGDAQELQKSQEFVTDCHSHLRHSPTSVRPVRLELTTCRLEGR